MHKLFRLFSWHISRTQSLQRIRHFPFQVCVVLNLLVSLTGCLVACSARLAADRHTHRQSTVTLAVHAHQGLNKAKCFCWTPCKNVFLSCCAKLVLSGRTIVHKSQKITQRPS